MHRYLALRRDRAVNFKYCLQMLIEVLDGSGEQIAEDATGHGPIVTMRIGATASGDEKVLAGLPALSRGTVVVMDVVRQVMRPVRVGGVGLPRSDLS